MPDECCTECISNMGHLSQQLARVSHSMPSFASWVLMWITSNMVTKVAWVNTALDYEDGFLTNRVSVLHMHH